MQIVFELIVTVADAGPGKDGDFSHDIARADVQRYIDAAHEHDALLLLDIQPGRAGFLSVARRWKWALEDPYVGLALDPEWRMGRRGVPGRRIGSVSATEVNRVSAWLKTLVRIENLPQKLFVLHQFRTDMVEDIEDVAPRRGLVMVQHVDGFGTPAQKLEHLRHRRPAAPVLPRLQAVLRRGPAAHVARPGPGDPAAGPVRELPVTADAAALDARDVLAP